MRYLGTLVDSQDTPPSDPDYFLSGISWNLDDKYKPFIDIFDMTPPLCRIFEIHIGCTLIRIVVYSCLAKGLDGIDALLIAL